MSTFQPLLLLNVDILVDIFDHIILPDELATEEEIPRAVNEDGTIPGALTALASTQICSGLRQTLINTPLFWGKVINLDFLADKEELREEIFLRTRSVPLCVQGHEHLQVQDQKMKNKSLPITLQDNWYRIQTLDIEVTSDKMATLILELSNQLSPLLERFRVQSSGHIGASWGAAFKSSNNLAPSLSTYDCGLYTLDVTAPWLCQLRTFRFHAHVRARNMLSSEVFRALSQMVALEELFLDCNTLKKTLSSLPEGQRIALPKLNRFQTLGDSWDCLVLFELLEIPSTCSPGVTITNPDYNLRQCLPSLISHFSRFAIPPATSCLPTHLQIDFSVYGFRLRAQNVPLDDPFPHFPTYDYPSTFISIRPETSSSLPDIADFMPMLALEKLAYGVKTLNLDLYGKFASRDNNHMDPFFQALENLVHLNITRTAFEYVVQLPFPLFPNLEKLTLEENTTFTNSPELISKFKELRTQFALRQVAIISTYEL
ncbi:hypothetical protein CPB83DRAFT_853390 [Crepidotus variabilis]|uniref:Uncharacterized protein n=1 Tax=Crepidotus variabilis TaxID=179855 RepID=A0A9P6EH86_9AGAR|nr:hypothetical protein CPB83DRAFT_853390 [Crepidotus variabilis]